MTGGGVNGIDYWEATLRADKARLVWVFDLPNLLLPADTCVLFTAAAGYSWFGNQSVELGGFPLPAYLNWQAGVSFTRKLFNLDLRYCDTNLSKEECFVFTGDPGAVPGGRVGRHPQAWSRAGAVPRLLQLWFALN